MQLQNQMHQVQNHKGRKNPYGSGIKGDSFKGKGSYHKGDHLGSHHKGDHPKGKGKSKGKKGKGSDDSVTAVSISPLGTFCIKFFNSAWCANRSCVHSHDFSAFSEDDFTKLKSTARSLIISSFPEAAVHCSEVLGPAHERWKMISA